MRLHQLILVLLFAAGQMSYAAQSEADAGNAVEGSVVKIFASMRMPDATRPWSKQNAIEATGSGVIIDGNRILTNAHVVAYSSQIQVQTNQSGDKIPAAVIASAPDVDLALLKLDDDAFFKTHKAVARSSVVPRPKDEVLAYGYPTGGTELSITKGIVSRVEFAQYNVNGGGLRVQVDAAINPGNSGGPVMANGRLIGLAFAAIGGSQNISYIIPNEEIERFLHDVADGRYDGKPYLFDEFQTLQNSELRAYLKLPAGAAGVVVRRPFNGPTPSPLREWDVITKIGDRPIDVQGMVQINDALRVRFSYLVQSLAAGGRVPLTVLRDGKSQTLQVPVYNERPALVSDLKGSYPSYFIYGPMSFSAASYQFVGALGGRIGALTASGSPLISQFNDVPDANRQEFVVVTAPLFSHRISVGYDNAVGSVVESINGVRIRSLAHLVAVLRDLTDEYVVLRFEQRSGENLVFKRSEALAATEAILSDNGIRSRGSDDMMQLWNAKRSDAP